MSESKTLIFVYNADNGYFNRLVDAAHKIVSPATYACHLCALTHGAFAARREWLGYLRSLPYPQEFLHADQFRSRFGRLDYGLPAVLLRNANTINLLISAESINKCGSLTELQSLIDEHAKRGSR